MNTQSITYATLNALTFGRGSIYYDERGWAGKPSAMVRTAMPVEGPVVTCAASASCSTPDQHRLWGSGMNGPSIVSAGGGCVVIDWDDLATRAQASDRHRFVVGDWGGLTWLLLRGVDVPGATTRAHSTGVEQLERILAADRRPLDLDAGVSWSDGGVAVLSWDGISFAECAIDVVRLLRDEAFIASISLGPRARPSPTVTERSVAAIIGTVDGEDMAVLLGRIS